MKNNINLEGIMYNGEEFMPFTSNEGNTNGKISHLRDTYMSVERQYFETLLSDKSIRKEFLYYLTLDNEIIIKKALELQGQIEYGELETKEELEKMSKMSPDERENYHFKKLEKAEGLLCLLLAAIRDKSKIIKLVRDFFSEKTNEPNSYGNHR